MQWSVTLTQFPFIFIDKRHINKFLMSFSKYYLLKDIKMLSKMYNTHQTFNKCFHISIIFIYLSLNLVRRDFACSWVTPTRVSPFMYISLSPLLSLRSWNRRVEPSVFVWFSMQSQVYLIYTNKAVSLTVFTNKQVLAGAWKYPEIKAWI